MSARCTYIAIIIIFIIIIITHSQSRSYLQLIKVTALRRIDEVVAKMAIMRDFPSVLYDCNVSAAATDAANRILRIFIGISCKVNRARNLFKEEKKKLQNCNDRISFLINRMRERCVRKIAAIVCVPMWGWVFVR